MGHPENLHGCMVLFEATGTDNLLGSLFSGINTGLWGLHISQQFEWPGYYKVYFVSLTVAHLSTFWFQSLIRYLVVSEICTTDFFHSWITSLAYFIFTGTSCCGIKYKYTLALRFVSLSGTYFPFLSSFRYLSAIHLGLQQMFRTYLCTSAQCLCTHISTGIRIAAPRLGYVQDLAHLLFCFSQAVCLPATKLHENDW